MADLSGWKAEAQDLPSLGTLHARAFHAKSEWHRKVFPVSLAPWWEEKYALNINDPTYHVLKIPSKDDPSKVLGLLSMRKYAAEERGAGRWSSFAPPPQIDAEAFDAMIKSMVDHRERYMLGRDHFCIDHFGTDAEHQGRGLGASLLGKACEIADQEKLDVFVEANEFAESFYHRFGFKTEAKLEMPGGMTECFLVRRCL